jgi:transcription termination/antitermination protein NusG
MGLQESPEQFEREPEESDEMTDSVESHTITSDENVASEAFRSLNVPVDDASPVSADDPKPVAVGKTKSSLVVIPSSSDEGVVVEVEGPAWYVIHCYSGYENKVRHNLEQRIETMGMKDMIFDVVIPTQEEIEVKDGKRRSVERHIFPGYVLVNLQLTEESWYVVRNTPGVTGFVGMGNNPTPLRPEEVSQIIKRMEADAPTIKVTYKVGERVRIIDGPFNDFRGVVSEIDMERTKVRVNVSFFGRETPVELDFLQVEKA